MAKKHVSGRVPPELAKAVERYAERWNMTKTDALTDILRAGIAADPQPESAGDLARDKQGAATYTLTLDRETADFLARVSVESDTTPPEYIQRLIEERRGEIEGKANE